MKLKRILYVGLSIVFLFLGVGEFTATGSEFDEDRLETTIHFIQHERPNGYTAGFVPVPFVGHFGFTNYLGGALLVETRDSETKKVAFCAKILFRAVAGQEGKRYWNSEDGRVDIQLLRGEDYFSRKRDYPTNPFLDGYADDPALDTFSVTAEDDSRLTVSCLTGAGRDYHKEFLEKSYGHLQLKNPFTYKKLYSVIDGMRVKVERTNKGVRYSQREFPFYYTLAGYSYWYDSINCFGFCLRLADKLQSGIFDNNSFLKAYLNHDYAKGITGYFRVRTPVCGISTLERNPFLRGLFDPTREITGLVLSTVNGKCTWKDYLSIDTDWALQAYIAHFEETGKVLNIQPSPPPEFKN